MNNITNDNKQNKNIKINEFLEFIKTIVWAFVIATLFRSFLYEPFHIPSGSMKPGLLEGDFIFVSKFTYGFSRYSLPFGINIIKERILDYNKPKRGEVIVFKLPSNPNIFYIKRLIGLPNDIIQIKEGNLYINNELIEKNYIGEYTDIKYNIQLKEYKEKLTKALEYSILHDKIYLKEANDTIEYKVPEGHYFFLGDNRDNSLDSRFPETGFVPYKNIVGNAKIIFFSKGDSLLLNILNPQKAIRFKRIFTIIK